MLFKIIGNCVYFKKYSCALADLFSPFPFSVNSEKHFLEDFQFQRKEKQTEVKNFIVLLEEENFVLFTKIGSISK